MASGKLSPRQRMINMMYLVLTALLALNISKDILDALTKLNEDLSSTVLTVEKKLGFIYEAFDKAAAENPEKAGIWRDKAYEVKAKSDEIFTFIEDIKNQLIEITGGVDEKTGKPKRLDNREKVANFLLNDPSVGGGGKARELRERIDRFRDEMKTYVADNPSLTATLEANFNTGRQKIGDVMIDWENATFEHYPLAAVLPFLTGIQANVRNAEADIISYLQSNIGKADLKFTDVYAVVKPNALFLTQGENYEAEIFLAAYDATQKPEVIINGQKLDPSNIVNGIARYRVPATAVGEKSYSGKIIIRQNGEEKEYEIPTQKYTVAPSSVVISPTAMNVLYRGVDNPLEVGVPGVDPSKVEVRGPGLSRKSDGTYTVDITKMEGTTATYEVFVKTDEGTRKAGEKKFRIKGLPQASGMIYNRKGGLFSANAVKNAEIQAVFEDFVFDLSVKVISFEVVVPGFPPQQIRGDRFDDATRKKIETLRPGSSITVRNIRAIGPKDFQVTNVSPISIDIQ